MVEEPPRGNATANPIIIIIIIIIITSEGFANVRQNRILTPAAEDRTRKLPKYDWPIRMVYATP